LVFVSGRLATDGGGYFDAKRLRVHIVMPRAQRSLGAVAKHRVNLPAPLLAGASQSGVACFPNRHGGLKSAHLSTTRWDSRAGASDAATSKPKTAV